MIIDISCDETMGVQSSHPTTISKPVFSYKGILHYAVENSPSLFYRSASIAISNVVSSFLSELVYDRYNDVLHNAVIMRSGEIIDEKILRFQKRI
jgi:N5-(carboxyethyl)ornithine synthase